MCFVHLNFESNNISRLCSALLSFETKKQQQQRTCLPVKHQFYSYVHRTYTIAVAAAVAFSEQMHWSLSEQLAVAATAASGGGCCFLHIILKNNSYDITVFFRVFFQRCRMQVQHEEKISTAATTNSVRCVSVSLYVHACTMYIESSKQCVYRCNHKLFCFYNILLCAPEEEERRMNEKKKIEQMTDDTIQNSQLAHRVINFGI